MNKINPPISDKKLIRIMVQEKIARMTQEEKQKESKDISEKLIEICREKNIETIVGYSSFEDEIDIQEVLTWCKENGKNVQIIPQSNEGVEIPEETLLIVPGRAFTRDGKRIGRGSGYYDRMIQKYNPHYTVGVCFRCQILDDIPEEKWDRRVHEVVFVGNTLE